MTASSRRVVIVGCGRQGAYLAARMDRAGWIVAVVDRDAEALAGLPGDMGGVRVVGDALTVDALEEAGIADADTLIATTAEDNRNAAIAVVGHTFGVPHAIARVRDLQAAQSFERLGIEIVCPTSLEARAFLDHLAGRTRPPTEAGAIGS